MNQESKIEFVWRASSSDTPTGAGAATYIMGEVEFTFPADNLAQAKQLYNALFAFVRYAELIKMSDFLRGINKLSAALE